MCYILASSVLDTLNSDHSDVELLLAVSIVRTMIQPKLLTNSDHIRQIAT